MGYPDLPTPTVQDVPTVQISKNNAISTPYAVCTSFVSTRTGHLLSTSIDGMHEYYSVFTVVTSHLLRIRERMIG